MRVISDDEELADVALAEEDFGTDNTVAALLLLLIVALDGILEDAIVSPSSKKTPLPSLQHD